MSSSLRLHGPEMAELGARQGARVVSRAAAGEGQRATVDSREEASFGPSLTQSAPCGGGALSRRSLEDHHLCRRPGDIVSCGQQEAWASLVLGSHGQRNYQESLRDACKSASRE